MTIFFRRQIACSRRSWGTFCDMYSLVLPAAFFARSLVEVVALETSEPWSPVADAAPETSLARSFGKSQRLIVFTQYNNLKAREAYALVFP